jgi:HSP20 family molecular chaperone IbpA|mmetsp:Transcript_55208/g.87531  ORF Transcript_55208/g.87531 Transcript_55208/m.87531 type:complete len:600 (+) Transcript_55208:58-1857(+)|eukprot:CAMPEP_0169119982 /NCGR_PEP_ID=MMETSP1015-20121227/31855_1 /TAXON_ID=342587 /ORGANISM="Karlodinium micrum, Strain CCMP2283" /LENGTH=599 /DNA_ID=CAMNT_0009182915 /DNA_START=53 /DNA_END=1852 /DNA_ORIENTATION=-
MEVSSVPMGPTARAVLAEWRKVWDHPRFMLNVPSSLQRDAVGPLLKLAASGVSTILDNLAKEEASHVMPHGSSSELLESALDLRPAGAPLSNPVGDPAGFVRSLIKASFQTGDGDFPAELPEAKVDQLIDNHCNPLLELAVAQFKDTLLGLRASLEKVRKAVEVLLAKPVSEDDHFGKAQRVQLSHRLDLISEDALQLSQAPESSPAPEVMEVDGATTEEAFMEVEEEEEQPVTRTKSQVAKQLQVEKVQSNLSERQGPIHELARTVSTWSKDPASTDTDLASLREALTRVEQAQKKARNYGEDLLEDMLALDKLSGLTEDDRKTRKTCIQGIDALLEDNDQAKSRLQVLHNGLNAKLKEREQEEQKQRNKDAEAKRVQEALDRKNAEEERKAAQLKAKEESLAVVKDILQAPAPDKSFWSQIKYPLKFHTKEVDDSYKILAQVPGLETGDIKVEIDERDNLLIVESVRAPSSQDVLKMKQDIRRRLQDALARNPGALKQLRSQDIDELYAELGQGSFGKFIEKFRIPDNADRDGLGASYTDGVLSITLPKIRRPNYGFMDPGFRGGLYGGRRGAPERRSPSGAFGGPVFGGAHNDLYW